VVTILGTAELQARLADERLQLVEVLPALEYEEEHLAGAVNLPLAELDADGVRAAKLEPATPTVVYGFDLEDDRGARAAARLEALGFADVAVYGPGKAGWLADALPGGGLRRPEQRVGGIADPDAALVPAGATIAEAVGLVGDADVGIVVDERRVVLGVLRPETFGLPGETPVADVLQPGPSTFRPSLTVQELVDYFRTSHESRALITTHEGLWLGIVRREDVVDG
jgi:rhodanese-related sulfurtransferase